MQFKYISQPIKKQLRTKSVKRLMRRWKLVVWIIAGILFLTEFGIELKDFH